MIGAIIGDIAGSRFEWRNHKSKEFELFAGNCCFTDDSVMSLAVAQAILDCQADTDALRAAAIRRMQEFGRRHIHAGYGGRFVEWIMETEPAPYNSWGNGAAMRVSACGFAANSLQEAAAMSEAVTAVTHNHPEGLKGAQSVAAAVYLAKSGKSKKEIKAHITAHYYNIDFTLDEIRDSYAFDVSCQGSVPQALEAFFESADFEDAIRGAVSIGGDSDTIAAIAGGIAEAYYGVPDTLREKATWYLTEDLKQTLKAFEEHYR